jgi:hypothetical protein
VLLEQIPERRVLHELSAAPAAVVEAPRPAVERVHRHAAVGTIERRSVARQAQRTVEIGAPQ